LNFWFCLCHSISKVWVVIKLSTLRFGVSSENSGLEVEIYLSIKNDCMPSIKKENDRRNETKEGKNDEQDFIYGLLCLSKRTVVSCCISSL